MSKMVDAQTVEVKIYIAGDLRKAKRVCREFCDEVGLCVTVSSTTYVYTGGEEKGVVIGFINYPRFPSNEMDIFGTAMALGYKLREELDQESFSVVSPRVTRWVSFREDNPPE